MVLALWLSFMALRFYDSMVLYITPCSMVNGVLWFLGSKSVLWFYDSLSYLITWLLAQMKHTVWKYKSSNITVSMLFPIFGDVTSVLLSEHLLFSAFIFTAYIFPRRHFRLRRSRAPKENTRTFWKEIWIKERKHPTSNFCLYTCMYVCMYQWRNLHIF